MTTTQTSSPHATSRRGLRRAWAACHSPANDVPSWARIVALAIPLLVMPSTVWRIAAVTLELPIAHGGHDVDSPEAAGDLPAWLPLRAYAVLLGVVTELFAFAAVGLVSTWGERFPRWIPLVRGRRVPVGPATGLGYAGAATLTFLWAYALVNLFDAETFLIETPLRLTDWKSHLVIATYTPLLLWGPLLAAVTWAYHRRRTTSGQ